MALDSVFYCFVFIFHKYYFTAAFYCFRGGVVGGRLVVSSLVLYACYMFILFMFVVSYLVQQLPSCPDLFHTRRSAKEVQTMALG